MTDSEHHDLIERVKAAETALGKDRAVRAFVASLSTRDLVARSAFASFAAARRLERHAYSRWSDTCATCAVCGARAGFHGDIIEDARRGGGFQHERWPQYVAYDLAAAAEAPLGDVGAEDRRLLRAILAALRAAPEDANPMAAVKHLRSVFPSNARERRRLLDALGVAGVLAAEGWPSMLRDRVTVRQMDDARPSGRNDLSYPLFRWRGRDGVDEEAARFWFGAFLG